MLKTEIAMPGHEPHPPRPTTTSPICSAAGSGTVFRPEVLARPPTQRPVLKCFGSLELSDRTEFRGLSKKAPKDEAQGEEKEERKSTTTILIIGSFAINVTTSVPHDPQDLCDFFYCFDGFLRMVVG